jgi:hypothetical protein
VLDNAGKVHFRPILNMLGVRYVVFREKPPQRITPDLESGDYWALINKDVAPRVFVPETTEFLPDSAERIKRIASPDFDPMKVAFVEENLALPSGGRGTGTVTHEIPTDVTISAAMENRGLLVLADNWDVGWQAYIDGIKTRVLRTDHALRGVVVPSGNHTIEFRFEPASMQLGIWVSGVAAASVAAWSMIILIRRSAYARTRRLIRYPRGSTRQRRPQLIHQ